MSLLAQDSSFDIKEVFYGTEKHAIENITSPYEFISSILPNIYILSGILLTIYLVFGGFVIVSSAGNPDDSGKGKQIITNAIMGFVIIFVSYWIVQIIEIITGVQILNFTK